MDHTLAPKTRISQAERTSAMRSRLLTATLDLVAEEGWAQASTQKICRRAGVSRGAQTHHFPTKESLLIAAVEEITARHQRELDDANADAATRLQTLEALFEFLWSACFDGPLLTCWMEALTAARTDSALRAPVRETDGRAITAMRVLGETSSSNAGIDASTAADLTELTVYLLRGMVIQNGVHPDLAAKRRLFGLWVEMVSRQSSRQVK